MNLIYAKLVAGALCVLGIFYAGWHLRDVDFMAFKKEVEHAAKAQEAYNEAVKKQQDIVTKGITNDYESKLAAVRNYYGGVQFNSSSRSMPGISAAPKGTDAETAYPVLAGQCAQTTAQLTSLQDWVNAQVGIK
jgi:hypothetical protein